MSALDQFGSLFAPDSVAIIGASADSVSAGNRFIRHMKAFGYAGELRPVHPTAAEVEGLKAFPSIKDIPGRIDYAYVAVAAARVCDVIRSMAGRVRIAQVMSSGFGETSAGHELQEEMTRAAQEAGVRVVGPNCLGVYSPRGRVTFTERTSPEAGTVGVVCQSGGLGIDIVRRGQNRGLRFSGLVTVGNCADVKASELLEYFLEASDTSVIGLYLEGAGDGRRLFEVLSAAQCQKPVVLLKGGRTREGQRAASSHTGALAGREEGWKALAKQTGVVLVESLDAMIDALVAFQCIIPRPVPTGRVVLFGNGGGTSVLGTDAFATTGFKVGRLPPALLASLQSLGLPAGSSILNPIDVPAGALQHDEGRVAERIIRAVDDSEAVDALVMHVNMAVVLSFRHVDMLGNLIDSALRVKAQNSAGMHVVLVLRSDGESDVEERKRFYRQRAVAAGVPVFDELIPAAHALAAVRHVEELRSRRGLSKEKK